MNGSNPFSRPPQGPPQPSPGPISPLGEAMDRFHVAETLRAESEAALEQRGAMRRVVGGAVGAIAHVGNIVVRPVQTADRRDAERAFLEESYRHDKYPETRKERAADSRVQRHVQHELEHNALVGLDADIVNPSLVDARIRDSITEIGRQIEAANAAIAQSTTATERALARQHRAELQQERNELVLARDPTYAPLGDIEVGIADAKKRMANDSLSEMERLEAEGEKLLLEDALLTGGEQRHFDHLGRRAIPIVQPGPETPIDRKVREEVHHRYSKPFEERRAKQEKRQERRDGRQQRRQERRDRREQRRQARETNRTNRQERRSAIKTGRSNHFFPAPDPATRIGNVDSRRLGLDTDPTISHSQHRKAARQETYKRIRQRMPDYVLAERSRQALNRPSRRQEARNRQLINR